MKVLQFIPSVGENDGGTTTYMQQLTACLGQLCELHVCALTPVDEFVPLEHCQTHSLPKSLLHFSAMKRAWMSLLNELQPDVVHVNCCWMPQIALVIRWTNEWRFSNHSSSANNSSLNQVPHPSLVLTPHGMLEPWILRRNFWTKKLPAIVLYQRRAVLACDWLIATSEEEKKNLLHFYWHETVALVQNGIDVASIQVKTAWKEPHDLLFMSRIHPKKGLELLFEAMNQPAVKNHFHLTIAGTGDAAYVKQLQQLVKTSGLSDAVSFVGPVHGERKWELIREADAVVLPSYSENYGLIVAEALASGTPVITTTGTPWQSLVKKHCGWWVKPEADCIASALNDLKQKTPDLMQAMGLQARKLATMDCSISKKVRKLYNLYLSNCVE